jgi:hypothetical protein
LTDAVWPEIVAAMPSDLTPLAGRARWAVIALVAVIATDVLAIGSDWLEIDLMNRVLDGADVSFDELDSNDTRQGIAGLLSFGAFVAAVVLFLRWFHAAYRNLKALGQPNLRFTTGWAIGGWFVPFLNLWRPKQIANDIWTGSGPDTPALDGSAWWKNQPIPLLLGVWWAAWIISIYVDNIGLRTLFNTDTAEEIRTADWVDITSLVVDAVAAILAIQVVRRLTTRQEKQVARTLTGAARMSEA